jgi:hypothetical protein
MNPSTSSAHAHLLSNSTAAPNTTFGDLYLRLLSPNGNGPERLRKLRAAARELHVPGSPTSLEQVLSHFVGQPVRLSESQRHALERLANTPALAAVSPWSGQQQRGEVPEMVSASGLHDIYLALLKPDGGLVKRFKAVQAAAALYEPGTPGSRDALDQELSRLVGRPMQLSEPQLRCFKELLVDEPAFAHIAPWEDLTASW